MTFEHNLTNKLSKPLLQQVADSVGVRNKPVQEYIIILQTEEGVFIQSSLIGMGRTIEGLLSTAADLADEMDALQKRADMN